MSRRLSLALVVVLLLSVGLVGAASASGDATIYVVHGIPGVDVDVCVDGTVAIPGFTFTTIAGPLTMAPGDVDVSLATPGTACAATILGPLTLSFAADTNYSVVAHLTEAGAPTASLFINNVDATGRGSTRLIAHHTAQAPMVDVVVTRDYYSNGNRPFLRVADFANGEQISASVRPGDWDVALEVGGSAVFGPATLSDLKPFTAYLIYAVGVFGEDSFQFLVEPIYGLK